jgi:hypothetical protein
VCSRWRRAIRDLRDRPRQHVRCKGRDDQELDGTRLRRLRNVGFGTDGSVAFADQGSTGWAGEPVKSPAFGAVVAVGVRRMPVPSRGGHGGGALVSALQALVPRRGRVAGQTRGRGRSRHCLPLGSPVRAFSGGSVGAQCVRYTSGPAATLTAFYTQLVPSAAVAASQALPAGRFPGGVVPINGKGSDHLAAADRTHSAPSSSVRPRTIRRLSSLDGRYRAAGMPTVATVPVPDVVMSSTVLADAARELRHRTQHGVNPAGLDRLRRDRLIRPGPAR